MHAVLVHAFFALLSVGSRANFLHLYANAARSDRSAEAAKLRCIVNYFVRVAALDGDARAAFDRATVHFERKALTEPIDLCEQSQTRSLCAD